MSDHPALPTWLPMDWVQANQAERGSRMEGHRRTAEAQDQINAARAQPTDAEFEAQLSDAAPRETPAVREMGGLEHAMKEFDEALREPQPTAFRSSPPLLPPHDAGGPTCNHTMWTIGCDPCAGWAVGNGVAFARHMAARRVSQLLPTGAMLLTGPEAERYRVLQTAARAAQDASKAAQVAGAALRDAFQTFCAGGGGGG